MNSLHVIGSLHAGGAERWVSDISLNSKDNTHYVLTLINNIHFDVGSKHAIKTFNRFSIFDWYLLLRFIKSNDIKFLHSHINYSSVFFCLLSIFTNVKLICHWHNDHRITEKKSNLLKRVYYFFSRSIIYFFYHRVFCVSKYANLSFTNAFLWSSNKVGIMPCGTTPYNNNNNISLTKDEFFNIVHFGRFVNQKNQIGLIDIFIELYKICPKIKLTIFGAGPDYINIKNYIEKQLLLYPNCDISLNTPIENVKDYMNNESDLLLMPSLNEGLPIVVMEAFSVGLPVYISSNVSPEIMNFSNVSIFDLNDSSSSIAKDISDIYISTEYYKNRTDVRNRLKSCFESSEYNIYKNIESFDKLYIELLN